MQLEAADWSIQATPPVHLQGFTPTCVQYWKAANKTTSFTRVALENASASYVSLLETPRSPRSTFPLYFASTTTRRCFSPASMITTQSGVTLTGDGFPSTLLKPSRYLGCTERFLAPKPSLRPTDTRSCQICHVLTTNPGANRFLGSNVPPNPRSMSTARS